MLTKKKKKIENSNCSFFLHLSNYVTLDKKTKKSNMELN